MYGCPANTLGELLLARVRATPHQEAFFFRDPLRPKSNWNKLTFKQAFDEAGLFSDGLGALGLKRGACVGVLSKTRVEWTLFDWAIVGAGAVTVPIYSTVSSSELCQMLKTVPLDALVVENGELFKLVVETLEADKQLNRHWPKLILIDSETVQPAQVGVPFESLLSLKEKARIWSADQESPKDSFSTRLASLTPSDLLTICFTSGTTGEPKGVELTHANLISVLKDAFEVYRAYLKPDRERILSFLPFAHVLGKVESTAILVFGWKQYFAESAEHFFREFRQVRPTVFFAVPRIFERAFERIEAMRTRFPKWQKKILGTRIGKRLGNRMARLWFGGQVRFAICGGAPLNPDLEDYFDRMGLQILVGYGLTETCAPVTLSSPDQRRRGSVGRPLPEVSIRIQEDGEIWIKSTKVFRRYFEQPEDTQACFADGWLKTGDLGRLDADGYLMVTDRKKDLLVCSTGKKVAPQKIESLARSLPFISECFVTLGRNSRLYALFTLTQKEILAYAEENQVLFTEYSDLVRHPKIRYLVQKTVDQLNDRLAPHERIQSFMILPVEFKAETSELTHSYKLRRSVILARFSREIQALSA